MSFEFAKGAAEARQNKQRYGHEAGLVGKTLEDMEKRQIAREEAARNEQRRQEARERRDRIAQLTRELIELNGRKAETVLSMRTRAIHGPAGAACAAAIGALAKMKCPACRFEIHADASMCGQCRTPVPADPTRDAARAQSAQDALRDIAGKIVEGMVARDALVAEGWEDCLTPSDTLGADDALEYQRVVFEARAASPNDRLDAFEDNVAAGLPPWAAHDVAVRVRSVFAELEGALRPLVELANGGPVPSAVGWVFDTHDVEARSVAAVEASRRAAWARAAEAGATRITGAPYSRIPVLWLRTAQPQGINVVEGVVNKDILKQTEVTAHTQLAGADLSKAFTDFLERRGGAKDGTLYVDRSHEYQALRARYVALGLAGVTGNTWIEPYVVEKMALGAKTNGFVPRPPAPTVEDGVRAAGWIYTTGCAVDPATVGGPRVVTDLTPF